MSLASVRSRVSAVPVGAWWGLAVVAGVGVLVWHEWANTAHPDQSWLDPEQPLPMVQPVTDRVERPRQRCYPASLVAWPCSKVGDC